MMKIRVSFILVLTLLTASSCVVWKKTLSPYGSVDTAIENSITDFINTSKLFKADSIFNLVVTDQGDYYVIGISGAVNKVYPYINDTVGAKSDIFPTKFHIREGKLFYWNDPHQEITKEVINVLSQYHAIDLDWRDREYNIPLNVVDGDPRVIYLPPMSIDDGKRGAVYYICKSDFTNYKKTRANTIYRHYKEPVLRCN